MTSSTGDQSNINTAALTGERFCNVFGKTNQQTTKDHNTTINNCPADWHSASTFWPHPKKNFDGIYLFHNPRKSIITFFSSHPHQIPGIRQDMIYNPELDVWWFDTLTLQGSVRLERSRMSSRRHGGGGSGRIKIRLSGASGGTRL